MCRQLFEIVFGCERAATARLVQGALSFSGYLNIVLFSLSNSADENYGFGEDIGEHFMDAHHPRGNCHRFSTLRNYLIQRRHTADIEPICSVLIFANFCILCNCILVSSTSGLSFFCPLPTQWLVIFYRFSVIWFRHFSHRPALVRSPLWYYF